jgi:HSP20 family protein
MAITRWDPFGEMLKMQRDMDRIFSRMGTAEGRLEPAETAWMPRINMKRSGDDLAVHVELAGIKPEDVDIEVTDGVLTLRGERKAETERENEGWMIRESSFGSFERSIALPEGVDPATIKADFHDGMLEIHVPKALELSKPATTKIAVGTGERDAKTPHSQLAAEGERPEVERPEAGMVMPPPPIVEHDDRPRVEIQHH